MKENRERKKREKKTTYRWSRIFDIFLGPHIGGCWRSFTMFVIRATHLFFWFCVHCASEEVQMFPILLLVRYSFIWLVFNHSLCSFREDIFIHFLYLFRNGFHSFVVFIYSVGFHFFLLFVLIFL